jgi:hypothetical protein
VKPEVECNTSKIRQHVADEIIVVFDVYAAQARAKKWVPCAAAGPGAPLFAWRPKLYLNDTT